MGSQMRAQTLVVGIICVAWAAAEILQDLDTPATLQQRGVAKENYQEKQAAKGPPNTMVATGTFTVGLEPVKAQPVKPPVAGGSPALEESLDDAAPVSGDPHALIMKALGLKGKLTKANSTKAGVPKNVLAVTPPMLKDAAKTMSNVKIVDLRFGNKVCNPVLDQGKIQLNCEIAGVFRFDYKPISLDPPTVKLVKDLEFRFLANRTSACPHESPECASRLVMTEFTQGSSNAKAVATEIKKQKPNAPLGEVEEVKKKLSNLLEHDIRAVSEKIALSLLG